LQTQATTIAVANRMTLGGIQHNRFTATSLEAVKSIVLHSVNFLQQFADVFNLQQKQSNLAP
jgi:hypothetical protein